MKSDQVRDLDKAEMCESVGGVAYAYVNASSSLVNYDWLKIAAEKLRANQQVLPPTRLAGPEAPEPVPVKRVLIRMTRTIVAPAPPCTSRRRRAQRALSKEIFSPPLLHDQRKEKTRTKKNTMTDVSPAELSEITRFPDDALDRFFVPPWDSNPLANL